MEIPSGNCEGCLPTQLENHWSPDRIIFLKKIKGLSSNDLFLVNLHWSLEIKALIDHLFNIQFRIFPGLGIKLPGGGNYHLL